MAKKPKHVEAIFDFNENVSQLLTDAIAFYEAIAPAGAISTGSTAGAGSVYLSISTAQITNALNHVAACRTAEIATNTRAIGAAPARDLALVPVLTDIHNFVALVQIAVNNTTDETVGKAIVTACTLHTRKASSKTKANFTIKNDPTTAGYVDFIFKAATRGVRAAYEIQESTDNVNWLTVKVTPSSRSIYPHGKTSGTKLYFRGRISFSDEKGGAQSWIIPPTSFIYVL